METKRHEKFINENDCYEFYNGGTHSDAEQVKKELKDNYGKDGELDFDSVYGWIVSVKKWSIKTDEKKAVSKPKDFISIEAFRKRAGGKYYRIVRYKVDGVVVEVGEFQSETDKDAKRKALSALQSALNLAIRNL